MYTFRYYLLCLFHLSGFSFNEQKKKEKKTLKRTHEGKNIFKKNQEKQISSKEVAKVVLHVKNKN